MKGRNLLISSLLIGTVCLGLASCASIISGTKADIVLNGNIDEPIDIQTDCKSYTQQVLPTTVQVKRGKKASKIEMSSENHEFNDILVSKEANGWVLGNLAFGGIVGFIVDFADGAAWKPAEESFYVNATKKIESQMESASSRSMIMETFSDEAVSVKDDDVDETVQHVSHSHTESNGSSFSEFLEDYIARWEEKGEFETTEQWKLRISSENINEMLPELSLMAKKLYIAEEEARIQSTVRLGMYDADNEVFVIHSDIKNIYVDVPLNIAPLFKEKWEEVEKQFEYDVKNDRLSIKSALFKLDGKEYHTVKVIKEQSYHLESKSVNLSNDFSQQQSSITVEPTHNVEYQDANVRSQQANPFTAVTAIHEEPTNIMHSNGNLGLHSVKYIDDRLVRFDINRLYYLDSENPDNLKYVDETFRECIQANKIRTTNDIEKADAIITGHAIDVEGGLLYYLTVVDASSDLLWQSDPVASKKANFKKSVKKAVKKSCKDLVYAFNAKVKLPISSPLHYMHKRINAPEFTTPDYLAALRLYEAEDYKAALKGFDRVIEANPYFADAYFFRSIANCKKRDINEGKRDMMYFHTLRPYDERFDDGIKYVYYEIALRAERRARNAQIAANVMNAVAVGTAGVVTALNNSKASTITTPVVNTSSSVRSTTATTKTQVCSICHGTGKNPSPSTVAQYGQVRYQYCDICKKTGTPHYHKVCFKCKGKGYTNY